MSTITRIPFSASDGGKPVVLARLSTPGDVIHTGPASSGAGTHYLTLYANNTSTSNVLTTFELGGTAAGQLKKFTIPPQCGDVTVFDRQIMGSSVNLGGFAAASSVITLTGWVDVVVN